MKLKDYIIKTNQLKPYSPDAHAGTVNRRIIGRETVESENLEVVLGSLDPGGRAEPHHHTGVEQVVYLLEGRLEVEMFGEIAEMRPGI